MIEFPKYKCHQNVVAGHGILRIGSLYRFEMLKGPVEVEVVKALVGCANLEAKIDGIRVESLVLRMTGERRLTKAEKQRAGEEESRKFQIHRFTTTT